MATIFRVRGLRVVIYANDHWPPHVHIVGAGCEAKVALGRAGERPSLITNAGLSRRLLAEALAEVDRSRDLLIQRWREIHGDA